MDHVLEKPSKLMAVGNWSPSSTRIFGGCCLITAVMLTACAGGVEGAFTLNYTMFRRHSVMFMTSSEMTGGETKVWSNFTSRVFRIGKSEEKARWPTMKLDTRSVLAIIVGGIGSSLTAAAGLGGGGLFVPLFNLLLRFDCKTSAALSSFVIVGGQFVSMVLNLAKSHPVYPERSLIDFDAALLLQPNLLLGISMGVIFNIVLPNWLITLLLTVVLSYMAFYSCKSGLKRWRIESNQMALSNHKPIEKLITPSCSSHSESSENFMEFLLKRHNFTGSSGNKIMSLAIIWLGFGAVQFVREGKGVKSKCGVGYWLVTACQIPLALTATHFTVENLRDSAETTNLKRVSESSDDAFVLGPEASSHFPKMALIIGVLGGMLGIAGAVIINPMLMSAGMYPQVTAATSGLLVVFSASMSVVLYWLMGRVPIDWALTSAALSALFSAVGILVVQRSINKYGRASFVVFLVTFVLGLSALLMAILGGWDVWQQVHTGARMGFHYPC